MSLRARRAQESLSPIYLAAKQAACTRAPKARTCEVTSTNSQVESVADVRQANLVHKPDRKCASDC